MSDFVVSSSAWGGSGSQLAARPGRASPTIDSLHGRLKAATRADHQALDAAMSHFDLGDAVAYGDFLRIHLVALVALSARWGGADCHEFTTLVDCVRNDLGERDAMPSPVRDANATRFSAAGVAYVVRGSRLGAAFLVRRVGVELPTTYLRHRVETPWPDFLAGLDALGRDAGPVAQAQIVASARAAFAVFADAAARAPRS